MSQNQILFNLGKELGIGVFLVRKMSGDLIKLGEQDRKEAIALLNGDIYEREFKPDDVLVDALVEEYGNHFDSIPEHKSKDHLFALVYMRVVYLSDRMCALSSRPCSRRDLVTAAERIIQEKYQ